MRLDLAILKQYSNINRSKAKKLIKQGLVKLNNVVITAPSRKVSESDIIKLLRDKSKPDNPKQFDVKILFENPDCIVIEKPAGMLTHAKGAELEEQTVASWLLQYLGKKATTNRDLIVHRLDRATSGVMILAKNTQAYKLLQKEFSTRKVEKHYKALVSGSLKQIEAIIEAPIERDPKKPQQFRCSENGRFARTHYKLARKLSDDLCLVDLHPTTGRTHQLRVHMKYIGNPIVGDALYGGQPAERMYLHAYSIKIKLPGGDTKKFISKLPAGFNNLRID